MNPPRVQRSGDASGARPGHHGGATTHPSIAGGRRLISEMGQLPQHMSSRRLTPPAKTPASCARPLGASAISRERGKITPSHGRLTGVLAACAW